MESGRAGPASGTACREDALIPANRTSEGHGSQAAHSRIQESIHTESEGDPTRVRPPGYALKNSAVRYLRQRIIPKHENRHIEF